MAWLEQPIAVVVAAFMGSVVGPLVVDLWKNKRSKGSFHRMVTSDVASRVKVMKSSAEGLESAITRAESESDYFPYVIVTQGITDLIVWGQDKWHLPEALSADILEFYNQILAIQECTTHMYSSDFESRNFDRERKLKLLRRVLSDMNDAVATGNDLLAKLRTSVNGNTKL
ncbi:hypothetical protein QCD60_29985 [Pokkaliibacter sp. MBI-7]|uniref:hypothetical protein n=1 Tax=Pokkaliibacter sp. MBI-7 TaxID=3040600 RepID=UPI002446D44B|nr:hypothetical protein [Pokkaliibacter sp. MBI-7]MDH2431051.1 hypothetical protein [Pokkaliibacter sp. MBI-7]MDH2436746.1 hypothetical protein [Pokkaliibacter sp. MBI-7]